MFLLAQFSFLGTGMVFMETKTSRWSMVTKGAIVLLWTVFAGIFIGTLSERDQDTDLLIAYTSLLCVILFANGLLAIYATMNQGSVFVYEGSDAKPTDYTTRYIVSKYAFLLLSLLAAFSFSCVYTNNVVVMHRHEVHHNMSRPEVTTDELNDDYELSRITDEWRYLVQVLVQFGLLTTGALIAQNTGTTKDINVAIIVTAWFLVILSECLYEAEDHELNAKGELKSSFYNMNVFMASSYIVFTLVLILTTASIKRSTGSMYSSMGNSMTKNLYV